MHAEEKPQQLTDQMEPHIQKKDDQPKEKYEARDETRSKEHKDAEKKEELNLEEQKAEDKTDLVQERKKFIEILFSNISHWLKGEKNPKQWIQTMLDFCEKKYENTPYLSEFKDLKAISLVYMSNKLEGTIPKGASQHQTYQLLESLMKMDDDAYQVSPWPVDSNEGNLVANKDQMMQHLRAYKCLCSDKSLSEPLTTDKIKEVHLLLLTESVDEFKQKVPCGSYRTQNLFAGDHQYPSAIFIKDKMERIVKEFNQSREHFILRAARLFFETISIHPFLNGNGRLCRLLIAYALMKNGVPFPISLHTNTKSRKRYMDAILRIRERNDYSFLLQLTLFSLYTTRKNYEDNLNYYKN